MFRFSLFKLVMFATILGVVTGVALTRRPATIELFDASGSVLIHRYEHLPFCVAIPPIEAPEDCVDGRLNCSINQRLQFKAMDEFINVKHMALAGDFESANLVYLRKCQNLTALTVERGLTMRDVKYICQLEKLNDLILPADNSESDAIDSIRSNYPSLKLKKGRFCHPF